MRTKTTSRKDLERALLDNPAGPGAAEIVAMAMGGATGDHEAARRAMERFGSLRGLDRASAAELRAVEGLGPRRAARIKAALEMGKRLAAEKRPQRPRFVDSRSVFEFVHVSLRDLPHEVFEILMLDARNALAGRRRVSVGTLTSSLVHPREVFRPAIRDGAAAIVVIHNHPSGDPTPSLEDMEITRRLVLAGELVGIRVLDHVVVGDGEYVSLADRGEIRSAEPAAHACEEAAAWTRRGR